VFNYFKVLFISSLARTSFLDGFRRNLNYESCQIKVLCSLSFMSVSLTVPVCLPVGLPPQPSPSVSLSDAEAFNDYFSPKAETLVKSQDPSDSNTKWWWLQVAWWTGFQPQWLPVLQRDASGDSVWHVNCWWPYDSWRILPRVAAGSTCYTHLAGMQKAACPETPVATRTWW